MLMRYVLKDEKGVGCNVASDSSVNSDHLTLDECLRLDQARKMATMQKKNTVKRKDSPSLETQQNTQTCLDSKINGFFNNISAKSGTKMPLTQSSGEGMEFHAPGITPLAPAVGTANFVNVIPLNIPTENQATEEEESVLSNTSVVATSETVSPLFTAASSSVAATNTPTTAAASPTSTSVSVATSTPSRAITPLPSQGSTVASSSTPKPDTKSSSLSGHPSSNATPAVTLNASNSNNSSSTLPIANVADAHTTASDALPSSTASNSSPSSPSSVPEVPETETSTSSAAEIGNKDSKQSKPELMSQSGAEQLATLLGCSSLAAKARRTVTDDSSKVVSKPESTSDTTETSNFPHSTMETKSSPITSTAGSGRRSVADLRCPPEIAKSFEEPDIVRRSDTGCPPMVPRTTSGYDDVGTNVVIEEKEKKKRKTSAKKKKAEVADEVSDEKSLEVATTVISEPSSDAPTAEENPFSLSSGDIVWAKNGSEPFWPGELFQFTRVNDVAGAVITWFGVDTFTPFVPLSKIEPFALKYSQRFNPKRNDRKYQKGVARGIYRCKPRSGYFENNLTKCIHEVLVNSYHFVLEPFEGSKKRKRKSTGFPVKKRRTAPSANHNAHLDTQSDEIAQPQEDEDHFDDDESLSVEDSSCVPEAEGECEHVDASSSEKNVDENHVRRISTCKSEDLSRTSPRSPSL
uniref:PWWP domain-containing protein n=1 Tax=Syphacia muris TaxID=451379 RepID=A0A0N5B111_9BILA